MTWLLAALLAAGQPDVPAVVSAASRIESPATSQSVHEVVVPAPPEQVWRAVSTTEGWRGWAAVQAWSTAGQPLLIETSYDRTAAPGHPANIKSLFVLAVPERLVAFRTVKAPAGFADFDALAAVTWLIELAPVEGGTRVRLTGSGYPRTPAGERILGFFMKGNAAALGALRDSFRATASTSSN